MMLGFFQLQLSGDNRLGADHLTFEGGDFWLASFFFLATLVGRIFFFSPRFSAGFFFLKKVSCLHLQNVFTFTLWLLQ